MPNLTLDVMSAGDRDDIDYGTTKGSDGDDENRFSFRIDKIYKLPGRCSEFLRP